MIKQNSVRAKQQKQKHLLTNTTSIYSLFYANTLEHLPASLALQVWVFHSFLDFFFFPHAWKKTQPRYSGTEETICMPN